MRERGFAPIAVILVVLTVLGVVGGIYYFAMPVNKPSLNPPPQVTSQQTSSPTNSQKPSGSPTVDGFKKKQFTAKVKFADQEGYPAELLNFNEDDLIGMKCTPKYSDNVYGPGDPEFYLDGKYGVEPQDVLTDQQKKELISKVNVDNTHLSDAQFCRTEDNRLVWTYGTDYFSPKQIIYFELSISNNTTTNVTKILGTEYAWFSCGKPLMLTKAGVLYYQCQGGGTNVQNPLVEQIIYSIDLNNKTFRQYSLKSGSSV